jgi:ADP-heptose:LPS heptosyltransferase
MPHKNKGYKHILVLRFSAMGDVAMTVPVIRALMQQYPNLKVTVVSRTQYKPFFDGIAHLHFAEPDFDRRHKGLFGLLKLYKDLRALHVHAVADLHNVLRTKVLTYLFKRRGKTVATLNKLRDKKAALTAPVKTVFEPLPHVTLQYAGVFAQLGHPVSLDNPVFPETEALTEDITGTIGKKNGTWIGIAPFAQHRSKVYPKDLMQQVIDHLAAQPHTTLLLFGGGRDEAHALKKFAGGRPNIVVIAGGRLNLKQELKVISNLDVMLSMDSANGHMAAMLGKKVVTLWGATHPYLGFVPFMQPESHQLMPDATQYPALPTSVYGNKEVAGYEDVMRTITPQMVINKLLEVINT